MNYTKPFTRQEFEEFYGECPDWMWDMLHQNYLDMQKPFKCLHESCNNSLFICRKNRYGVHVAMCEEHWNLIQEALP